MPKINGNEIRPGTIVEHDGGLWASVKVNHVKPGKGGAFAQVELKNLRDGRKLNERFRSEDKVEQVELEMKDQQFLYETDGRLVFMDNETYEQIELDADGRYRIEANFFGLYGVTSPLPTFYTEDLIDEMRQGHSAGRDFVDILHAALYPLLFRAWEKHRIWMANWTMNGTMKRKSR